MDYETFKQLIPELYSNYKPSDELKKQISNVTLLMTVGPSGVGKTTLMRGLDCPLALSTVTRKPREGEQDGLDYHFRSDYEQLLSEIKQGKFLQIVVGPAGDFYGTRVYDYPNEGIATQAIVAETIELFKNLGFKKVITAFITPPNYEEWMRRVSVQNFDEAQKSKRLVEAERSFRLSLADPKTHFVLNDQKQTALVQIKNLLNGQVDERAQQQARSAAADILARLAAS